MLTGRGGHRGSLAVLHVDQDFRRGSGTVPHQNRHMEVCPALELILIGGFVMLLNVLVSNALLPYC